MKSRTDEQKRIIDFLIYSERLKTELRHASKNDGQRESAAEHSWRLSLFLLLVYPKLEKEIDLLKALKITIIHDIVEIDAKDIPVLEQISDSSKKDLKDVHEKAAMDKIEKMLGDEGVEIRDLWYDYLEQSSYESKIVRVLDKIEGQMQFMSEDVKRFTAEEQDSVRELMELTRELSKIDPYIEELYKPCEEMIKERTRPE